MELDDQNQRTRDETRRDEATGAGVQRDTFDSDDLFILLVPVPVPVPVPPRLRPTRTRPIVTSGPGLSPDSNQDRFVISSKSVTETLSVCFSDLRVNMKVKISSASDKLRPGGPWPNDSDSAGKRTGRSIRPRTGSIGRV